MSSSALWQHNNDEYLAAALAWLRLLLLRQSQRSRPTLIVSATPADSPKVEQPRSRWGFGGRDASPDNARSEGALPALPPPSDSVTDDQVAQATAAMEDAAAIETPALILLGERLGLTRFERETLLLCAALELDTRMAGLCARAHDDPSRTYPTFALALALFDEPAWDVLSPERPLRYWRLIEINQPGAQPLTSSALRADERIVNYLKGLNYLDDRVAPLLIDVPQPELELPPSQQQIVDQVLHLVQRSKGGQRLPAMQFLGPDSDSKQLIAAHLARRLGLQLHRMSAELLPAQPAELETLARLWQRESILLPLALYLYAPAADASATPQPPPPLGRFLMRSHGLFIVDTPDARRDLHSSAPAYDIRKPTPDEQAGAWQAALAPAADDVVGQLVGQFNLSLPAIEQIAADVAAGPEDKPLLDRLWDASRISLRPRLETLAQRLDLKMTWDDLVLPAEQTAVLHQIAAQVGQRDTVYRGWGFAQKMNRGLGISALFTGDSGTGKTMAAEVIANGLRLDLYRIDLSAVVSKYIGETEKNIRRLFDSVEDGSAILFFDEADALFGKRSEVKDSHDRYANIEINYLLQRMEAYRGLAILATNMKNALDKAFLRRLRFVVDFPFPDAAQRREMWQRAFPPDVPSDELDYDYLARLNLTGGNIHNVALNAAFLAAHARTPVTMALVLSAARIEFRKLDRAINETDFTWKPAQVRR